MEKWQQQLIKDYLEYDTQESKPKYFYKSELTEANIKIILESNMREYPMHYLTDYDIALYILTLLTTERKFK